MVPRGLAIYLGVVQFFFAVTWVVYVIYLPQLALQAGIDKFYIPWILFADQLVFALMDVLTGFWIDRVRAGLARFGGWILGVSTLSCASFIVLPFAGASAPLLLFLVFVWAVSSSALRSPPWALLSRYAATPAVPWLSTLVLTGTAVAAVITPFLGVVLKNVDPRLPFIVSSLTLLLTVAGLIAMEKRAAAANPQPAGAAEPPFDLQTRSARRLVLAYFSALLVMAAGFQVHASLNSAPQYLRYAKAADLPYLMPVFWVGFNVLMFPAAGLVKRFGALALMAASALAGAAATLAASLATGLEALLVAQFAAGGCWGAASVAAYSAAIAFGRTRRQGAFLGSLFALLALAALVRIGAYASDIVLLPEFKALAPWLPPAAWLLAALALVAAIAGTGSRAGLTAGAKRT